MNVPLPPILGGMLDPNKGSNWSADAANIQQPFDANYAQAMAGQNQASIAQQQGFVNALNQFNGAGNQASVFSQQQMLANQLQQQAQGGGPNPALAQLSQTTSANAQNQAAMMASQRGASANPALMAAHIANQQAQLQQQAGGQAATLRAQQQLAAQQALAGQQAQMAGTAGNQIGQQQQALGQLQNSTLQNSGQVYGTLAAQNNANVGMQSNQNDANSKIATGNQSAQQGIAGGVISAAGSLFGSGKAHGGMIERPQRLYVGGEALPNSQNIPNPTQNISLGQFGATPNQAQSDLGKTLGSQNPLYAGIASLGKQKQQVSPQGMSGTGKPGEGGGSGLGFFDKIKGLLNGGGAPSEGDFGAGIGGSAGTGIDASMGGPGGATAALGSGAGDAGAALGGGAAEGAAAIGEGGAEVGALAAAPVAVLAARGGQIKNVGPKLKTGGKVPGKAKVSGDSLKNDTVSAKLSPGEIVIPRTVLNSRDPVRGAADFVAAILSRQGRSNG